jgi:hypothetical protein
MTVAAKSPRFPSKDAALLAAVWAACSLTLLLFRPGYPFPPFELLDSWIYTSYQWDLRRQIAEFGPTYYGARLTWILPGALIHSLLPAPTAIICYKLIVSAVLAIGCGAIVYRAAGFAPAALAVGLGVVSPQIIVALHTDYIDTPVILYGVLALACITRAKDSARWALWIFLGGVGFTGMMVSNLSTLAAPGLGIALFHLLWLRWSVGRHALSLLFYLAGAALVIGVIELVSRSAGASWFFLKPQIDMLFYMNALKDKNPWTPKNWEWAYGATWLVVPVCTLILGAFRSFVFRSANQAVLRLTQALTGGLAVSLLFALIFELRGMGVMSLYYYSSFHLCFALPLLVLACANDISLGKAVVLRVAAPIVVILSILLWGDSLSRSPLLFRLFSFLKSPSSIPLVVAGLLLVVAGLLAVWRAYQPDLRHLKILRGELLLTGLVFCSFFDGMRGPEISDRLRERYTAVNAAYWTITREFRPASYRFWIEATHRDGVSLASTKLWGYRLFTLKPFPDFDQPDLSGITLIVPAASGQGTELISRAYEAMGARGFEPVAPRILSVPGTKGAGFDLVCFTMGVRPFDPERADGSTAKAEAVASYTSAEPDPYMNHLGSVVLGSREGDLVSTASGYPIYRRTDPGDHLATLYVPVPAAESGQLRQFALVLEMPEDGSCTVLVQDEAFRQMHDTLLTKSGHHVRNFAVPAEVKQLRLVLASREGPQTPLPTRMTLYMVKP